MSNIKNLFAALGAIGVTAVVPSANAGWHSMVGDALSPLSPSLGCFSQYNGAITNTNCGGAALAQLPIILDSAGNSKLFKVRTLGQAVGVAGFGAHRLLVGTETARATTVQTPQTPQDDVQADITSTRESTDGLAAQLSPQPAVSPSASPGNASRSPREDPGERAPEAPSMEDERDFVKTKFIAQAVDPSWARAAKSEVTDAFSHFVTRESRIRNVECRTSICAVEVDNDNEAAYRKFATTAFEPGNLKLPNELMVTRDDNSWRMVVYLAREGIRLPMLE